MTQVQMWNLLVGAVMPPLVSVVIQSAWPKWLKAAVALATAAAIGVVTAALAGELDAQDLVGGILTAAIAVKVSYEAWWKPTGISPTIETKTNV